MQTRVIAMLASAIILAVGVAGPALAKPGDTGKSGVTFGGGVPGGGSPGPAQPTRPTQPAK